MNNRRTITAILAGALTGGAASAIPLWMQRERLTSLPAAPAPRPSGPLKFPTSWESAMAYGGKADVEIRAATLAEGFTATECREALDAAIASGKKQFLSPLLCRWAEIDGGPAFEWLIQHEDRSGFDISDLGKIEDFYSTWAFTDPAGFAAQIEKAAISKLGNSSENLALACVKDLLQFALCAAIRAGGNIGMHSPAGMALSRKDLRPAIRTVADAQAIGAEVLAHPEWLSKIEPGKPLYLLVALRECWQEIDPDGWDRWAAAHPEAAEKSDNQPVHPGIKFLRSPDRAVAATEALQSAPPEKLEEISTSIVRLWDDLESTGQWLNSQPEGPAKNAAAQAYALESAREDPNAAMHWADAITDPAARARTQRRVFTAWHDADPAAAAAWLPQSGWSAAQLQAARDIMAAAP